MSRTVCPRVPRRHLMVFLVVLAASVSAGVLFSRPSSANDIAHYHTFFDTDVASAGYGGMRDIGTGTITLAGVSGTVNTALLFWHGPTDSTSSSVNASVTFDGHSISGTNIGVTSDNNWGYDNSQAYRADVTSYVSGNGTFTLSNFTKGSANVNGASLIVFFDDGNDTNNRDVVVFDGNDSNQPNSYDANGWNVTLPGINYTSGAASIDLHVSDGQSFGDDALVVNGTDTIAPSGSVFQGDSVPNGASAGSTNGGLWDIHSYDVTASLTPGPNTLSLTSGVLSDYLSLIVALVNLPAGAAPTGQPEPTLAGGNDPPPHADAYWPERNRNCRAAGVALATTTYGNGIYDASVNDDDDSGLGDLHRAHGRRPPGHDINRR